MPVELRKFKTEIKSAGYSVEMTQKGHYCVIKPGGGKLIIFAVMHGKGKKGGEVLECYVNKVRKVIKEDKGEVKERK